MMWSKIFNLTVLAFWGGVGGILGQLLSALLLPYNIGSFWLQLLMESLAFSLTGFAIGISLYRAAGRNSLDKKRILISNTIGGAVVGAYIGSHFNEGIYPPFVLLFFIPFMGAGIKPVKKAIQVIVGGLIGILFYLAVVSVYWYYVAGLEVSGFATLIKIVFNFVFYVLHLPLGFYLVNLGALTAFWRELEIKKHASDRI